MDRKELLADIENRFQLALVMAIFLPSLLSSYFAAAGWPTDKLNKIVVSWSLLVGFYVASYIIFQIGKRTAIPTRALKGLSAALLLGIGLFVAPIVFLATMTDPTPITWSVWVNIATFKISVWGLPAVTEAIFVLVFCIVAWGKAKSTPWTMQLISRMAVRLKKLRGATN